MKQLLTLLGAKAWSPGLSPSCALASSSRSPSARPRPHKQAARELNSASSDLESKPIPDRDLERGLRAPVIAAVVEHRREPSTCTRAASAPERNCTSVTPVRSRLLYLLSYRGKKASCAGIEPALPDGESGVLGHWTNTTSGARGRIRTCALRRVEATFCY